MGPCFDIIDSDLCQLNGGFKKHSSECLQVHEGGQKEELCAS